MYGHLRRHDPTIPAARAATRLVILAATLAAAGCASRGAVAPPEPDLRASIDSIIDAPPLHRTHWGILVRDAATGAVLYERNADRHFIPASNMKLFAVAAAFERLGGDYRYHTQVLAGGRLGESAEALVVVGSGDPTWSARFHPDAAAPLDSLAARVAATGVRQAAELIVDAARFTDLPIVGAWEVGDLPWRTAPPTAAFAAAEGTFRIVVTGGRTAGDPAAVEVIGALPQPVSADLVTDTAGAPARVRVDFTARRDTVYLSGSIGVGAADTSTLALTRPAESTAAAFADALRRRDIEVGTVLVVHDTAAARLARSATAPLAGWHSPPLDSIAPAILRPSQNWMTEQLVKTLGAETGDGSWAGGFAAIRAFLAGDVGVDTMSVNLRDGSGLSAQNLLTPAATVALLRHASGRPWADAFRRALPAAGERGGTLASRLEPLGERVRAKTGTISNVNSLSGYLRTDGGRDVVFSIMSNGSGLPASMVRAAIDDVVLVIAR